MAARPVGVVDYLLAAIQGVGNFMALYRTQGAGATSSVEEKSHFKGAAGEAAKFATAGHGADKDAGVGMVTLHADTVTEDGSSGERARGVDGDHANGFVGDPDMDDELIDERAFARARRSGDTEDKGAAGLGKER